MPRPSHLSCCGTTLPFTAGLHTPYWSKFVGLPSSSALASCTRPGRLGRLLLRGERADALRRAVPDPRFPPASFPDLAHAAVLQVAGVCRLPLGELAVAVEVELPERITLLAIIAHPLVDLLARGVLLVEVAEVDLRADPVWHGAACASHLFMQEAQETPLCLDVLPLAPPPPPQL